MPSLYEILQTILLIVKWTILTHFIMSWLINFQVLNLRQPIIAQAWSGLNRIVQPVYRPIRRLIPPMQGLDFAPLLVLIGVYALQIFLDRSPALFG